MVAPAYPGDFGRVIADHAAQIRSLWAAVRAPQTARSATPLVFAPTATAQWVPVTSSSFVNVLDAQVLLQQPNATVVVRVAVPAATTAEVQLYDVDNSTVIDTGSVAASTTATLTLTGAVSGAPMDVRKLAIRAKLATGSGTVLIEVLSAYGTQT